MLGQYALILETEHRPPRNAKGVYEGSERAAVEHVLQRLDVDRSSYELGYSKVFLRAGVLPRLNAMRSAVQQRRAVQMQAGARRWLAKRIYLRRERERLRQLKEKAEAAMAFAQHKQQVCSTAAWRVAI